MLPTPTYAHLESDPLAFDKIYEPSEDSFILLDALEADKALLRKPSVPFVLEIGSGSGIVTTFLQKEILHAGSVCFAVDINALALKATQATSEENLLGAGHIRATSLDVIHTSLLSGLRVPSKLDIVVFNPPYVPTPDLEICTKGSLTSTWAGGVDGMVITSRLLPDIASILSETGVFYLVTVARNRPQEIIARCDEWGLVGSMAVERKAGREKLGVIRFSKKLNPV